MGFGKIAIDFLIFLNIIENYIKILYTNYKKIGVKSKKKKRLHLMKQPLP
ncbi:hypothetical protein AGMMS50249_3340 [candidate division SR1 bacterium]|nr:hypothetical protein AGMMS50249_3340 [candidate division SR1 bacterium]